MNRGMVDNRWMCLAAWFFRKSESGLFHNNQNYGGNSKTKS